MNELWRNIDGYKGVYQVSSFGRIRSYKYNSSRILKPRINRQGYLYINLCEEGKYKSFTIHRIVSKAFLGKSSLTVNHKNGNKLNNCIENLEWISQQENTNHAKFNNLLAKGEKNGKSKLSIRDVELIRYKYKNGKSMRCIGKEFSVSHNCISKIINNKSWN